MSARHNVANSFYGTKVILNGNLPEIDEYKKKYDFVVFSIYCSSITVVVSFKFCLFVIC